MIENFTSDEIEQIIKDLKGNGYVVKDQQKRFIMSQEAEKLGISGIKIPKEARHAIYEIADWATDNKTKKTTWKGSTWTCKNPNVDRKIEKEYRKVVSGLIKFIKPYMENLERKKFVKPCVEVLEMKENFGNEDKRGIQ